MLIPEQGGVDANHMISLLEDYVQHLRNVERESRSSSLNGPLNYYMPSDSVSPDEWAEFDNVYQVHSPRIYLDNIIRDVSDPLPFLTDPSLMNRC